MLRMHYTEFYLARGSVRRSKTGLNPILNAHMIAKRNRGEICTSYTNRVAHALPTTFTVTTLASAYTSLRFLDRHGKEICVYNHFLVSHRFVIYQADAKECILYANTAAEIFTTYTTSSSSSPPP